MERVASNMAALRTAGQPMRQSDVAERLAELGRPMGASALSKMEQGDRRIDVDDLVALALALRVSPLRLLLGDETAVTVKLTPEVEVSAADAWDWALGSRPLAESYPPEMPPALAADDFQRRTWPAERRLAEDQPALRAATEVASLLRDHLMGSTATGGKKGARRRALPLGSGTIRAALRRLLAECLDLLDAESHAGAAAEVAESLGLDIDRVRRVETTPRGRRGERR